MPAPSRPGSPACKHLVVIGAGLIGLEAAASAAELGIEVTVIEFAPRIMARACDEETGAIILAEHQHHGVEFDLSASVTQVTRAARRHHRARNQRRRTVRRRPRRGRHRREARRRARGSRGPRRAGRHRRRRAVPHLRSRIFSPPATARASPGPQGAVRLENWRHAQDHGAVAGRNAAGAQRQLQHRAVVLVASSTISTSRASAGPIRRRRRCAVRCRTRAR